MGFFYATSTFIFRSLSFGTLLVSNRNLDDLKDFKKNMTQVLNKPLKTHKLF
jgi:hypothetical protein